MDFATGLAASLILVLISTWWVLRPPPTLMGLSDFPFLRRCAQLNRNLVIAGSVVLFHVAALWALQSGLLRRAVEIVVPVAVLSEIVTPPAPKAEQPPELRSAQAGPPRQAAGDPESRDAQSLLAPQPLAVPYPEPSPQAPVGVDRAAAACHPLRAAPRGAGAPPLPNWSCPPATRTTCRTPRRSIRPSASAWANRARSWCACSSAPDGAPQKAELKRSSGFERLDQAALEYVMKCRYVPGKVGGRAAGHVARGARQFRS